MSGDAVTALRCGRNYRATKRWHHGPDGELQCEGFDCGAIFRAAVFPFAGLFELASIIDRLRATARAQAH